MYRLSDKAIALSPYDPSEGVYRVRMDANESFLLPTDLDRKKMAQAAADIALNRYPDPLARLTVSGRSWLQPETARMN